MIAARPEWYCRHCGATSEVVDRRCLNCNYAIDGEPPPRPEDDGDSRTIQLIRAENVG
jgi:hypothetical protein